MASDSPLSVSSLTRREFLLWSGCSAAALAAGCAANPVTGEQQLMLVPVDYEIEVDRQNSPHQFSADYGAFQDPALNAYLDSLGRTMASLSHRPGMPYSFRAVNAAYVNAYAFPGGSIAVTRGILLGMESEAELASLLGHELGHVNARHTAQQMTTGLIAGLVLAGVVAAVGDDDGTQALAAGLGGVAAGLLLARYSRDNERQADQLAMEYMVRAGYSPQGLIDLMDMLRSLHDRRPNVLELMFSTHPMSDERYRTASQRFQSSYPQGASLSMHRERYMDSTASIRRQKSLVEALQDAGESMGASEFDRAEEHLRSALKAGPSDYTALLMTAKLELSRERPGEALRYAEEAHFAFPGEPQALHVRGLCRLETGNPEGALDDFTRYGEALPGNPNTIFFKGLSLERMSRIPGAAEQFALFLREVSQGDLARYAATRLREWGYPAP